MGKARRSYVSVSVDVPVDEVLEELSDDDLLAELEIRRNKHVHVGENLSAEIAYYALTPETPQKVREFVAAAAGRIA